MLLKERKMNLEYHTISDLFPLMEGEEFESLVRDIAENGLLEPIWLYEGQILDGRNRYRACLELEIEPEIREYKGNSPNSFVISMNVKKRHLSTGQRAASAVKLLPILRKEAKERQGIRTDLNIRSILTESEKGKARDIAAKKMNSSSGNVYYAEQLQQKLPETFDQLWRGEITMSDALKDLGKLNRTQIAPLPEKQFKVIYADPPWEFYNQFQDQSSEKQYGSLPLEQLKEMKVKDLAKSDAVLFLWTPCSILEDALELLNTWGFEYKANFVWIKDKAPGMGWWVNSKHEMLLIGVRGSGNTPNQKFDSWFEAPVERPHSKKPDIIYEMIEAMYEGPYIELFARQLRDGWEVWGDEI